ncbi:hypothetical protein LNQ03_02035 [Klebsiella pneumoniae subsp. pneumoniae]|nr:hypothetical protein [Klebsiella pneumoniae subsp. pneumoniae]
MAIATAPAEAICIIGKGADTPRRQPPPAIGWSFACAEHQHPDPAGLALLCAGVCAAAPLTPLSGASTSAWPLSPAVWRFGWRWPCVRRLLWGICLFSLNYPLVAALHGFPEWFFGHAALPFRRFYDQ